MLASGDALDAPLLDELVVERAVRRGPEYGRHVHGRVHVRPPDVRRRVRQRVQRAARPAGRAGVVGVQRALMVPDRAMVGILPGAGAVHPVWTEPAAGDRRRLQVVVRRVELVHCSVHVGRVRVRRRVRALADDAVGGVLVDGGLLGANGRQVVRVHRGVLRVGSDGDRHHG